MKKGLRDAWCAALRSGEHKQCRRWLRKGDAFCALGVLVLVRGGEWVPDPYAGGDVMLPSTPINEIRGEVGLYMAHADHIAVLNDESGATFPQIADWIEEHVPCESE